MKAGRPFPLAPHTRPRRRGAWATSISGRPRRLGLGFAAGVAIANAVSERVLEVAFACLVLFVAFRTVQRSFSEEARRRSST